MKAHENLKLTKMIKNHEGCVKGYHRSSKAWYAKSLDKKVEVNFGMFHPEGGTTGEMSMEWVELSGKQCARLKCFEDAWSALALFTDLIQEMGKIDNMEIQEKEFCNLLDSCGFKDLTEYEDPYLKTETPKEEMVTISIPKGKAKKLGLLN